MYIFSRSVSRSNNYCNLKVVMSLYNISWYLQQLESIVKNTCDIDCLIKSQVLLILRGLLPVFLIEGNFKLS